MARLTRGDVHLVKFAPPDKQRPVVILTRNSALNRLTQIAVAPITSAIRGVPSEIVLDDNDGMRAPCAINLYNVTTIPESALGRRVATLSEQRMWQLCGALRFALGCD